MDETDFKKGTFKWTRIGCKHCSGKVIEAEKVLDIHGKMTEFECLNCGRRFEFATPMYVKILDKLKVDYLRRIA